MTTDNAVHEGDEVTWHTHGTTTQSTVEREIASDTQAAGRAVRADEDNPQCLVKSDESGREAVHRPEAPDQRSGSGGSKDSR